jgi:hypothetical protein
MSEEKHIRLSVLQMAQSMCDAEYLIAAERGGAQKPFPTTADVIKKADELMAFVDDVRDIRDPTVKNVTELLSEHLGK